MKYGTKEWNTKWPPSRCKRIVRPLLSKIHGLTDMYNKNPALYKHDIGLNSDGSYGFDNICGVNVLLVKPGSASERLDALKPYISLELYQSYREIFHIFKAIIATIDDNQPQGVVSLRQQCCHSVGKTMVLTARTSHHKLNQSILFDSNTLPDDIKRYVNEMLPDIDDWFELEPRMLYGQYTKDLLLGYIIHLLIFNLQHILYMLLPTLIHWLYEYLVVNNKSRYLLTKLFSEYWRFSHNVYFEGSTVPVEFNRPSNEFWQLYKIGYWDHFISSIGFHSQFDTNHYEHLLIDTLVIDDKLSTYPGDKFSLIENDIYDLITRNYYNYKINYLLIQILTELIHSVKSSVFIDLYDRIIGFIKVWLSFKPNQTFNSSYPGNEQLFNGLIRLTSYISTKNKNKKFHCLHQSIILLKNFYLDIVSDNLMDYDDDEICDILVHLYVEHNDELNDFIDWLDINNYLKLADNYCQNIDNINPNIE